MAYMVEVEKKFEITPEFIDRMKKNAIFVSEKSFTDSYYDNDEYALTRKDWWLRSRDGNFEFKTPYNNHNNQAIDQYHEYTEASDIQEKLELTRDVLLSDALKEKGYSPFATIITNRMKYKLDPFIIDVDTMDFGYALGEIELVVEDPSEIEAAVTKIQKFAEDSGLTLKPVRGKVVEYLRLHRPDHYQSLIASGILKGRI